MSRSKRNTLSRPSGERTSLSGPDLLTLARFPLAGGILAIALATSSPPRWPLVVLLALGVVTDLIDGPWARRLGVSGDRGARLDSAADVALTVGVAIAVVRTVEWSVGPWAWWAIATVAVIRLSAIAVTFARFHVVSIAHTWANKVTGITIAAAAIWALASGHLGGWPVGSACAVAALAATEELIMSATARAYFRDRQGWWDNNCVTSSGVRRPTHGLKV